MSIRRTALITGSSSGIGLGIARALAAEGMNLFLHGIEAEPEVETICSKLAETSRVDVAYRSADLATPDGCRELVEAAKTRFGGVDVLVNSAGIQFVSPVDEFPDDKWQAVINLNLSASFYTIKHVLPLMRDAGWGRIINIASAHGLVASPFKSAYVAAKHGILGLTKTVALEVAEQGITINAICPAYVWTPLVEKQIPATAKARGITEEEVKRDVMLKAQPTRRFVQTEEIGALAAFLCSESARSIHGTALPVDGGWTAQ